MDRKKSPHPIKISERRTEWCWEQRCEAIAFSAEEAVIRSLKRHLRRHPPINGFMYTKEECIHHFLTHAAKKLREFWADVPVREGGRDYYQYAKEIFGFHNAASPESFSRRWH